MNCHCFFANLALMVTQEVVVVVLVAVRKCHDLFIIADRLLLRDHKSLSPNCVMTHHLTRVILDESKRIERRREYRKRRVLYSFGLHSRLKMEK